MIFTFVSHRILYMFLHRNVRFWHFVGFSRRKTPPRRVTVLSTEPNEFYEFVQRFVRVNGALTRAILATIARAELALRARFTSSRTIPYVSPNAALHEYMPRTQRYTCVREYGQWEREKARRIAGSFIRHRGRWGGPTARHSWPTERGGNKTRAAPRV